MVYREGDMAQLGAVLRGRGYAIGTPKNWDTNATYYQDVPVLDAKGSQVYVDETGAQFTAAEGANGGPPKLLDAEFNVVPYRPVRKAIREESSRMSADPYHMALYLGRGWRLTSRENPDAPVGHPNVVRLEQEAIAQGPHWRSIQAEMAGTVDEAYRNLDELEDGGPASTPPAEEPETAETDEPALFAVYQGKRIAVDPKTLRQGMWDGLVKQLIPPPPPPMQLYAAVGDDVQMISTADIPPAVLEAIGARFGAPVEVTEAPESAPPSRAADDVKTIEDLTAQVEELGRRADDLQREADEQEAPASGYACPKAGCTTVTPTYAGLNAHIRAKHGPSKKKAQSRREPAPETPPIPDDPAK